MKAPAVLLLTFFALGCSAPVAAPPQTAAVSPNNIVVYREGLTTLQASFIYAGLHCRAHGRGAIFRNTQRVNANAVLDYYDCDGAPGDLAVAPPTVPQAQ